MEVFHVVRTVSIFPDITLSSWSKGFNSVLLAFLHLLVCMSFNTGNGFSSMNFVWFDRMSIQVLDCLHWISSSFDLNFVWLHSLLYFSSNLTESGIYSCLFDAGVCGIFDCCEEIVISRVESNCEGAVDHSSFDVSSKIYFANIIISDYSIISRVRSIMSCNIVKRATSWKCDSRVKSFFRS